MTAANNAAMDDDGSRKERGEFLQFAIRHLEARIRLVDNKATILIGIVSALGAVFAFLAKEALPTQFTHLCQDPLAATLFLLFSIPLFVLPLIACLLLLWAVRPTKCILGLKVKPKQLHPGLFTLLWPSRDFCPSRSLDEYSEAIKQLPCSDEVQYQATHFTLLQLVQRKYKWYGWATRLLKVWVLAVIVLLLYVWFALLP